MESTNEWKLTDRSTRTFIYVSGFLLLSYTIIRAYLLSLTWDEAYTYLEFVRKPYIFLNEFNLMAANDHLLNTWLMKITAGVFGNSEFSLRLPNLFAHLIYLLFSIRILKAMESNYLKILCFALLNFNPFILDFFSAARGYGLSLAFMMASLYYIFSFFSNGKRSLFAFLTLITSALAVLSNLNLFPFFISISIITIFFFYKDNKEGQKMLTSFILASIFLAVGTGFLMYSFKLKECGALFFGGDEGFFKDTLVSLFSAALYDRAWSAPLAIALSMLTIISLLIGIIISFSRIKQKHTKQTDLILISTLTFLCLLAPVLQHFILGTKYPVHRGGLFLFPLFTFLFVFLIREIKKMKWVMRISSLSVLLLVLNLGASANFNYLLNWSEGADVKKAIKELSTVHDSASHQRFNLILGTEMMFDPAVNYYRVKDELTWLNPVNCREPSEYCDYYFTYKTRIPKLIDVRTIKIFSDTLVLVKNEIRTKDSLAEEIRNDFDHLTDEQNRSRSMTDKFHFSGTHAAYTDSSWAYSNAADHLFTDTSIIGKKFTVSASAMVYALDKNFDGRFVISFEDSKGSIYSWLSMDIRDFVTDPRQWTKIYYTRFSDEELKGGDHVKIYLWNRGKSPICLDDLDVRIIAH